MIIYGIICLVALSVIHNSANMSIYNSRYLLQCIFSFEHFEMFLKYILAFNYADFLIFLKFIIIRIYVHLNVLLNINFI